jgi:hypothetical protein
MISIDDIKAWTAERFSEVREEGGLSIVGLLHFSAGGGETALHAMTSKMPADRWNPETVASTHEFIASRHARGLNGVQQFQLVATYGATGKPAGYLPFQRVGGLSHGALPNGGLATEAATPTGMAQQAQRWGEIVLQGATQKDLAVTTLMAGMIKELRAEYTHMFAESRELFLALRKLSIETAAAQQEQGLRLIMAKRNAALAHEGMRMLPAALNGLTGKEIFPSGTADTVHLRNLMLMFDEEQLQIYARAVAGKGPEAEAAFGLLVNRLAELRKQEAADERKMAELVGERNPDYDAAEHDAAGMIDPRKVLTTALSRAARSNGDAPPPGVAKALDNGHGSGEPAAAPASQDAAKTDAPTDPFVLKLFEGAGPQEIQVLASMYEARGLTGVASELRERFAAFEKGQTP